MKKQVLIRGVDEEIYRQAKATAATLGISMGSAVEDALSSWSRRVEKKESERELLQNQEFIRSHWNEIKKHKGKVVVVAEKKLQGSFETEAEARGFSSRFRIAMTFPVKDIPKEHVIEFGPEMAV